MTKQAPSLPRCPVGPETVRMLQLGHPWVIADRYTAGWPKAGCGTLVELCAPDGKALATALLDPGARVVARMLDAGRIALDAGWVGARLLAAATLRRWLDLGDSTVWRLVNGEGDGLPGLTIDRYGEHLLVQYYTRAWEPHLPAVVQALMEHGRPRAEHPRNHAGTGVEQSCPQKLAALVGQVDQFSAAPLGPAGRVAVGDYPRVPKLQHAHGFRANDATHRFQVLGRHRLFLWREKSGQNT